MQIGLPLGFFLFAAGEIVQPVVPSLGSLSQVGAVGVLAWIAYSQHNEQKSLRKQMHDDSAKLNGTLMVVAQQCATTQETFKRQGKC